LSGWRDTGLGSFRQGRRGARAYPLRVWPILALRRSPQPLEDIAAPQHTARPSLLPRSRTAAARLSVRVEA